MRLRRKTLKNKKKKKKKKKKTRRRSRESPEWSLDLGHREDVTRGQYFSPRDSLTFA